MRWHKHGRRRLAERLEPRSSQAFLRRARPPAFQAVSATEPQRGCPGIQAGQRPSRIATHPFAPWQAGTFVHWQVELSPSRLSASDSRGSQTDSRGSQTNQSANHHSFTHYSPLPSSFAAHRFFCRSDSMVESLFKQGDAAQVGIREVNAFVWSRRSTARAAPDESWSRANHRMAPPHNIQPFSQSSDVLVGALEIS